MANDVKLIEKSILTVLLKKKFIFPLPSHFDKITVGGGFIIVRVEPSQLFRSQS